MVFHNTRLWVMRSSSKNQLLIVSLSCTTRSRPWLEKVVVQYMFQQVLGNSHLQQSALLSRCLAHRRALVGQYLMSSGLLSNPFMLMMLTLVVIKCGRKEGLGHNCSYYLRYLSTMKMIAYITSHCPYCD